MINQIILAFKIEDMQKKYAFVKLNNAWLIPRAITFLSSVLPFSIMHGYILATKALNKTDSNENLIDIFIVSRPSLPTLQRHKICPYMKSMNHE